MPAAAIAGIMLLTAASGLRGGSAAHPGRPEGGTRAATPSALIGHMKSGGPRPVRRPLKGAYGDARSAGLSGCGQASAHDPEVSPEFLRPFFRRLSGCIFRANKSDLRLRILESTPIAA